MMTTLAERLKLAMAGPPKVSQAELAKECGVSPPSVSDWIRGVTKSIDAVYLIRAADFLKVRPRWLAEGIGPREIETPTAGKYMVMEPRPDYAQAPREYAKRLVDQLPQELLKDSIAHMEWLIEREKRNPTAPPKMHGLTWIP